MNYGSIRAKWWGDDFRANNKWRKTLAGTLVLLGFVASAGLAIAEVRIDITQGHLESLPIAISDFYGKEIRDGEIGADIAAVVSDNLERSGLFKPVDKGAFLQKPKSSRFNRVLPIGV